MRIVELDRLPTRAVSRFDSQGFLIGRLGLLDSTHVMVAAVEPGGIIGRHPTVGVQVLIVLQGSASVSGENGIASRLQTGQAAAWAGGEQHETRSEEGLLALIIEGQWRHEPGEPT